MNKALTPLHSFKWTMRILGFVIAFSLGIANLTLRRRLPPVKAHGGLFNFAQFKNLAFTFYTIAGFVCFLGIYTGTALRLVRP